PQGENGGLVAVIATRSGVDRPRAGLACRSMEPVNLEVGWLGVLEAAVRGWEHQLVREAAPHFGTGDRVRTGIVVAPRDAFGGNVDRNRRNRSPDPIQHLRLPRRLRVPQMNLVTRAARRRNG